MSTLGKIFTVLNVVAAIALCALLVGYIASDAELKVKADAALQGQGTAVKALSVYRDALAAVNADRTRDQAAAREKVDAQMKSIEALNIQLTQTAADKAKADAHLGEVTKSAADAQELLKVATAGKADLEAKYAKAAAEADALLRQNAELTTRTQDLGQKLLDARTRAEDLERQLVESKKEAKWLNQHAETPLPAAVPVLPTVDLHGVVTEVDAPNKIAAVNLGSSDQVVSGMPLVISRGTTYIADLIITKVDENAAVGRLEVAKGQEVRRDDNVTYTVKH